MPSASQRGIGAALTPQSIVASSTVSSSAATATAAGASTSGAANTPNTTSVGVAASSSASSIKEKPSSRLSLLSRLNLPLPLRNRSRNVVDFHIRPDEPHKQYSPGNSVRGAVVLVVVKPLRITHLVVSLHGYVQVFKDPAAYARAQGNSVAPRGGITNLPQYHGNGLASLFQDEQVLSGEGRLEPGRYEFGFDLMFPNIGLPSSIEFERGSISYMITATLTRPTTIAPTTSCDRRVVLVQQLDIGHIPPPRPRTIFLEPISKRTRKKRSVPVDKLATLPHESSTEIGSEIDSTSRSVLTEESFKDNVTEAHRSGTDGRSEFSGESNRSVSTGRSRGDMATTLSHIGSSAIKSPAKQQVVDNKTITATIELLKGGHLPGDPVTVRVSVQHIKRLKSMTGVIVTLFRQGKIDSSPSATLFSGNSDKATDEAYPQSRTGLGGLSISSASSRSMFRKDLDQNTAPLLIDPVTLHASITVSLKMPDDCFPTVKGVPGGMIGFKYQVEVIVDLGGRLSSQISQGSQSSTRFGPYGVTSSDQPISTYGPRGASNILDTTPLRQKGVISVSMETVVGTTDSSRTVKPWPSQQLPRKRTITIAETDLPDTIQPDHVHAGPSNNNNTLPTPNSRPPYSPPTIPLPQQSAGGPSSSTHHPYTNGHVQDAAPAYIPRPQLPEQNSISEKERIRQAETRLLPSQPPTISTAPTAPTATTATAAAAAAPLASNLDDDNLYDAHDTPPPIPTGNPGPSSPDDTDADAGPSAPPLEHVISPTHPTEDKQELERRRLIEEASAPPEFPDDIERSPDGPSAPDENADEEPTAPVLDEENHYGGYNDFGTTAGPSGSSNNNSQPQNGEQLPAYQR